MKARPYLSILIPTKNRSHYLPHAIASALQVPSSDIEIIVSENFGSDNGLEIARSFQDPRLQVMQPPKPLAMHDHFEFLLSQSEGEWVTFIGDDDAILPNALTSLQQVSQSHPAIEAIYSARAYFFWPNQIGLSGSLRFPLMDLVELHDSKETLNKILTGQLLYCYGPQMYSGGFHRRTLVQRVRNAKGRFFYSAIPDANSALNALLFTFKFARIGIPLTIVGTSPKSSKDTNVNLAKDRDADHLGALKGSTVDLHPIINDYPNTTFSMSFLETYLNASPLIDLKEVDLNFVRPMVYRAIIDHQKQGRQDLALSVAAHCGLEFPSESELQAYNESYPDYTPDPIPGSTIYYADSSQRVDSISTAIILLSQSITNYAK